MNRLTISLRGLDLFDRNRLFGILELEQSAQRAEIAILVVDQSCVLLKCGGVVGSDRVLELRNRLRIQQVIFALDAELVGSTHREVGLRFREGLKSVGVLHLCFAR